MLCGLYVFMSLCFNFSVMLTKCLFVMLYFYSISNNCFIRYYLIVFTKHRFATSQNFPRKKNLIDFWNFLVSLTLILSSFQNVLFKKYSFLIIRRKFVWKFPCFLQLLQFKPFLFFKFNFFILERNMIALHKSLIMYKFSLAPKILFFIGA